MDMEFQHPYDDTRDPFSPFQPTCFPSALPLNHFGNGFPYQHGSYFPGHDFSEQSRQAFGFRRQGGHYPEQNYGSWNNALQYGPPTMNPVYPPVRLLLCQIHHESFNYPKLNRSR